MSFWEPFHPVPYFLHTSLGALGLLAAVAALWAVKGSYLHVRAGRVFAFAAAIAALTALVFSATRLAPPAIASSLMVLGLVASAMLALRSRTRWVAIGEWTALALISISAAGLLLMTALPLLDDAPIQAWAWPLAYAFFPVWFLLQDVRFMPLRDRARHERRLPRHLSRMAFAFAIAVHAPLVSFGDAWGIDPVLAFFGPFALWPIIVVATRGSVRRLAVTAR